MMGTLHFKTRAGRNSGSGRSGGAGNSGLLNCK